MNCRRCNSPVKYAGTTLCEECTTDPAVCPSVNEIAMPSFVQAQYDREFHSIESRNPEQANRYDELHDEVEDEGE